MPSLVKNNHARAECVHRTRHSFPLADSLQCGLKIVAVSPGCSSQERKHVPVQPLRARPVNDYVRDGQDLEQKSSSGVLVISYAQETLGVEADDIEAGIEGSPDSEGTGGLLVGGLEDLGATEEGLIEGVALAIAGVAEDRDHLDLEVLGCAAQLMGELL